MGEAPVGPDGQVGRTSPDHVCQIEQLGQSVGVWSWPLASSCNFQDMLVPDVLHPRIEIQGNQCWALIPALCSLRGSALEFTQHTAVQLDEHVFIPSLVLHSSLTVSVVRKRKCCPPTLKQKCPGLSFITLTSGTFSNRCMQTWTHISLYVQYIRHRPPIVCVWLYRDSHRAPATSIVARQQLQVWSLRQIISSFCQLFTFVTCIDVSQSEFCVDSF